MGRPRHELLTAHDILVYATIARYADGTTGVAWPSGKTVAERPAATSRPSTGPSAGWSRRASWRSTSGRHELGESNVYIVHEIVAHQDPKAKVEG
jgi:hypothetical protein